VVFMSHSDKLKSQAYLEKVLPVIGKFLIK